MKYNKSKYKKELNKTNLIGSQQNRTLLELQSEFRIALCGGSFPMNTLHSNVRHLVDPINLSASNEKQDLIFSGLIYTN